MSHETLQISWSGCKDSQTSADTAEAGQATGAMSYAFMTVLGEFVLIVSRACMCIAHNFMSCRCQPSTELPGIACQHSRDSEDQVQSEATALEFPPDGTSTFDFL